MAKPTALSRSIVVVIVWLVVLAALPTTALATTTAGPADSASMVSDSDAAELRDETELSNPDSDVASDATAYAWGADPANGLSPVTTTGIVVGAVGWSLLVGDVALAWSWSGRQLDALPVIGRRIGGVVAGHPTGDTDSRHHPGECQCSAAKADSPAVTNEELVPDEVRVRRLLERDDGRVRQSAIVDRTSWSKSKVSRLLSRMAENEEIVKITLGRENLICLPGHETAIARPRIDA